MMAPFDLDEFLPENAFFEFKKVYILIWAPIRWCVSYTKSYFHRNGNKILYRAKKFKDECRFPNFDFPTGSVFLGGKTIAVSI